MRLLILLGAAIALWYFWHRLRSVSPGQQRLPLGQVALLVVAGVLVALAITGRIHWLGAVIGALLPLVKALLPLLAQHLPGLLRRGARSNAPPPGPSGAMMTRDEALAILGLEGAPQHDEIIRAHRRLMQRLHPDRGGNDYLAAKLNAAKELLLAERSG